MNRVVDWVYQGPPPDAQEMKSSDWELILVEFWGP